MSDKKKLFSTLGALTVGAVIGTAVTFNSMNAFAHEHEGEEEGEHACGGEGKCGGDKEADDGEHACGGEGKCGGDKE